MKVADELASAITANSSIEDLRLRNNKITTSGFLPIARSLSCITTLKSLNVQTNQLTENAADDLSLLIKLTPTLRNCGLVITVLRMKYQQF